MIELVIRYVGTSVGTLTKGAIRIVPAKTLGEDCKVNYSETAKLKVIPREWLKMRIRDGGIPATFIA